MNILDKPFTYTIKFTLGQALLDGLIILFVTYIGWELYWWNKIGLYFIKWHTHLAFTGILVGCFVFIPVYIFSFFTKGDALKKAASVAVAVWMAMMITEGVFLITGSNKMYIEKRDGYYRSPFDPETKNYYHVYHCGDTVTVRAPEFSYLAKYNSLGFLGNEWQMQKDSSRKRVITLGDSFTEGDGAPMDSCYPALMQNMLGNKFEVLNAGVRGSDPVFGIKNFEDRLLPFQPDLIVQSVSENDLLFDMCIRGGYERFQKDSTVKFNSPPWWEPIYAMSYSSRVFFRVLGWDLSTPCGNVKNPALVANQNRLLQEVFDRFEKTAALNNTKVLVMFFPTKYELFSDTYVFDFSVAKSYIEKLPHLTYVDLYDCYSNKIKASGTKAEDYYWKIDGHHNSTGYKMMAECVAERVLEVAANDTTPSQSTKPN